MLEALQNIRAAQAAALALVDQQILDLTPPPAAAPAGVAWGAKVSPLFLERVQWVVEDLDIGPAPGQPEPDWLMAWIAWESDRTFRADIKNMAGSGAVGLIQFMPKTAAGLGTTTAALAAMEPERQLNFVWKYFAPFKGRIRSLADGYMAILWPPAVGKPLEHPLWDRETRPTTYRQNAGLDADKDGTITKAEAAAKVYATLAEGQRRENRR
ncbi:MAG: hypothetical protein KBC34_00870 [Phenylobacterium sp.]|nr:hypothetical protein [Phenylobacterium sp.]